MVVEHVVDDGHADVLNLLRLDHLLGGGGVGDVELVGVLVASHLRAGDVQAQRLERLHGVEKLAEDVAELNADNRRERVGAIVDEDDGHADDLVLLGAGFGGGGAHGERAAGGGSSVERSGRRRTRER